MSSLINSNRKDDVKPLKRATLADLNLDNNSTINANKPTQENEPKGRKTTLSIDRNTKNMLQAMVFLGDAPNQKEGFAVAINAYYDNLPEDKKTMFDLYIKQVNNNL